VGYSATSGIVSSTDRSTGIYRSIHGLESFIQTDAPINPGNSGGPLVGIDGHIIGVNSNILSRTGVNIGIGFAIPSNLARRVAEDLIRYGHVRWPGIGVDLEELSADSAKDLGLPAVPTVRIQHVLQHSPASGSGLKPGDVVLAVNQSHIRSLMNFRARVACCRIGETMSLHIWRNGVESDQTVTPIDRDEVMKQRSTDRDVELKAFGLRVGVDDGAGLVVTDVESGSVAALAAFAVGDRLLRDDESGHELKTLEDAEALAKHHELVLLVLRDGQFYRVRMHR
jgi:S1-C subfamily serine protease